MSDLVRCSIHTSISNTHPSKKIVCVFYMFASESIPIYNAGFIWFDIRIYETYTYTCRTYLLFHSGKYTDTTPNTLHEVNVPMGILITFIIFVDLSRGVDDVKVFAGADFS